MSDTTMTAAPPPAAPAPAAPARGLGTKTYVLAGCSIGGTLCASLASTSGVNLPFAIASAVFGGIIVLMTAAPGVAAAAAPASAAGAPEGTPVAAIPAGRRPGTGIVAIGISAAVLSFIMSQIAQFAVGYTLFGVNGNLTSEQVFMVSDIVGTSIIIIRVPFDLLIGAYLVSHARNIFGALGIFAVAYLVCYLIEQTVSAAFGMSGLFMTAQTGGLEAVLWGFLWVLGIPLACQAVGAFGAAITNWLTRRKA